MSDHNALNSERLKTAFDMLCKALKEALVRYPRTDGHVSLKLHLKDGIIRKPEIECTEYPSF
jgi:hypothetical protein